jgi:hypothetical protein
MVSGLNFLVGGRCGGEGCEPDRKNKLQMYGFGRSGAPEEKSQRRLGTRDEAWI